jgi:capsular exopolysaccharide synthesis family protein
VARVAKEVRDLAAQVAQAAPAKGPVPHEPAPAVDAATGDANPLPEVDMTTDFYEAEVRQELDQLNREITKKEVNKRVLANKVEAYSRRLNMSPDVIQELATLTHDRDAAKERYSYLSTRKLNSDLAGKVDTDANNKTFSTIDPPNLPQAPISPDRPKLELAGVLAGLMLGFGCVFAREVFDATLKDEDDAAKQLQLPILTSIPKLAIKGHEKKLAKNRKRRRGVSLKEQPSIFSLSDVGTNSESVSDFSRQIFDDRVRDVVEGRSAIATEQYQMMRADLIAQKHRGMKRLIITSAVPGEGKTFVASCLAGILAKEQDRKVLLVDADLRTGSAGYIMGIENRNAVHGLSDVLSGKANVEDSMIPYADGNLFFLPAGHTVQNPIELLSSPRLQEMLDDLTMLFDWVIVDSPPIVPIADTNLLIPVCDAAIVVVRADSTPVSLAKQAVSKVGREKVSGVILNCVRKIKTSNYYGHYYHNVAQAQR